MSINLDTLRVPMATLVWEKEPENKNRLYIDFFVWAPKDITLSTLDLMDLSLPTSGDDMEISINLKINQRNYLLTDPFTFKGIKIKTNITLPKGETNKFNYKLFINLDYNHSMIKNKPITIIIDKKTNDNEKLNLLRNPLVTPIWEDDGTHYIVNLVTRLWIPDVILNLTEFEDTDNPYIKINNDNIQIIVHLHLTNTTPPKTNYAYRIKKIRTPIRIKKTDTTNGFPYFKVEIKINHNIKKNTNPTPKRGTKVITGP